MFLFCGRKHHLARPSVQTQGILPHYSYLTELFSFFLIPSNLSAWSPVPPPPTTSDPGAKHLAVAQRSRRPGGLRELHRGAYPARWKRPCSRPRDTRVSGGLWAMRSSGGGEICVRPHVACGRKAFCQISAGTSARTMSS